MENIHVQHDLIHHLFFTRTPMGIARLDYSRTNQDKINLRRTYVPADYREKGIGSALVDNALTYAKERDLKVEISCPFVQAYMKDRHRKSH